ncbi:hypothetical protein ACFWUU_28090 [Kribbella sp. NPDC058693]
MEPDACTLIGDQPIDVQAARAFGAASIGYANAGPFPTQARQG